jgi:hypothetical protein
VADPKKYRDEAERLRMEALWVKDPEHRALVLKMAALYDRLAAHAEKMRRDAEKKP